jgi:hypothetical protein
MQKTIRYLAIGAALQLLLVALVYWPYGGRAAQAAAQPLLTLAAEQVSDIAISDKNASVHLVKTAAGWQLPDYQQLPAATAKVSALLDKLRTQPGWPVSTSADSVKRFGVGDDQFERKLQFKGADGKAQVVYLGSSPGFRKVHARRGGDNAVYAIELNTADTPVETGQWLDKTLLALNGDITALSADDVKLTKGEGGWQLEGVAAKPDQQAVERLLQQLHGLIVEDVVPQGPPAQAAQVKTLTAMVDGKTVELQIKRDKDTLYVNGSTRPQWFRVAEPSVAALLTLNAAALQQQAHQPSAAQP